jgi:hypothetical protein
MRGQRKQPRPTLNETGQARVKNRSNTQSVSWCRRLSDCHHRPCDCNNQDDTVSACAIWSDSAMAQCHPTGHFVRNRPCVRLTVPLSFVRRVLFLADAVAVWPELRTLSSAAALVETTQERQFIARRADGAERSPPPAWVSCRIIDGSASREAGISSRSTCSIADRTGWWQASMRCATRCEKPAEFCRFMSMPGSCFPSICIAYGHFLKEIPIFRAAGRRSR